MPVIPLWPHQSSHLEPLGCDYAAHGQVANLDGTEVAAALDAGGSAASAVVGWVDGLLTGVNMAMPDTFDISPYPDEPIVQAMVLDQALSHARHSLHAAAFNVVGRLRELRAQSDSPRVTLFAGRNRITIRQQTLKTVQQALIRRGWLRPPRADGVDSLALRAALHRFQVAAGLTPSGLPCPDTVLALLQSEVCSSGV